MVLNGALIVQQQAVLHFGAELAVHVKGDIEYVDECGLED